MGIDFIPQNPLEQAIYDRNREMLIHAVAEGEVLTTLAPASNLGDECFPDEVIFAVLFIAATGKQVKTMTNGWFWGYLHAGERLRKLTEETLAPLPQEPSPLERALIKAIVYRKNEEIIRLIEQENIKFHGFAVEEKLSFARFDCPHTECDTLFCAGNTDCQRVQIGFLTAPEFEIRNAQRKSTFAVDKFL